MPSSQNLEICILQAVKESVVELKLCDGHKSRSPAKAVAGLYHSIFLLDADKTAVSSGRNLEYQLGNGGFGFGSTPLEVLLEKKSVEDAFATDLNSFFKVSEEEEQIITDPQTNSQIKKIVRTKNIIGFGDNRFGFDDLTLLLFWTLNFHFIFSQATLRSQVYNWDWFQRNWKFKQSERWISWSSEENHWKRTTHNNFVQWWQICRLRRQWFDEISELTSFFYYQSTENNLYQSF